MVGELIGQVLDFGQVLRDEFITPITDFLSANDPADSDALVSGVNTALSGAGSPITLVDSSTTDVFKADVTEFDFDRALEDVPIDFGEAAEALNIDFAPDAIFDFVPNVLFDFDFGLDLDDALSPSEAFFFDVSNLDFAVETPESFVAGGGSDTAFDLTLDLGTLGDVSVTNGTFDLNAALDVAFTDPNAGTPGITLDELSGASLTSLLTVTPDAGNGLTANFPLSATLAGTSIGSADLTVGLTGASDVFGDFGFDVDLSGADFQAFKNFTNITPGDIVGTLAGLGTQLQAITQAFNLPEGIPFVEDTLGELLDYTSTIADLVDGLFDLGLQGAAEVAIGELTGQASFDVIVDGVTHAVTVPASTALNDLVSAINDDLPSGVTAELDDDGRLAIAAVDSAIETLTFANVNQVATDALGFQNEQTGIPLFDFVTWQDFETIVDDFLAGLPIPGDPIALAYDAPDRVVSFVVEFSKTVADQLSFNFNETIDLGVADLVLTGGASAAVSVPMEVRLEAGFDLTPLADGTSLDDLNGGEGVEVTAASTDDLILVPSDGSGAIGVDLNGVTDVAGLKSAISSQTTGKVVLEVNATQNGFVLVDTTFDPSNTTDFMVSVAGTSAALPGLGFGIGLADSDGDGRLAGGEVLPRFFLTPFDEDDDTGSFATGGLSIAPANLSLSAALGFLEVGASGSSSTIEVFGASGLTDPDDSGRIFLDEFGLDVVDVTFGPAPFEEFSGEVIGSFTLTLEFFDAETYGIDLAPADRTIVIALMANSPTFTPDVDLSGLPDLSTILQNFQNLSIPQMLQLVGGIVEQLTDTPLFDLELPLLDQSINDLITLVSDQINAVGGDFATLKADLEAQVVALENAINQAASLQAIGPDLQARLFAAVEGFDAAVEDVPTDFNIVFDANPTRLISAFRALVDVTDDIGAVGGAVALFNNLQGTLGTIRDKVPSGDRLVRLLAEALGFDIKALTDTVDSGTVQDKISEALGALTSALQSANIPDLPDTAPMMSLQDALDEAQAALDDAVAKLTTSLGRLNDAIADTDIFAALRSVGPLTEGLAQLREAIQTLTDADPTEFKDQINELQSYLDGLLSDVRDRVFEAFPLGALTFDLPDGDTLAFDVHFARSLTQPVNVEFDLDVPGISDLVPLTFDGEITGGITLGADFTAGFGIALDQLSPNDLSNLDQAFFINRDSEIALTAFVDIPDVEVTASIGGLKIGLGDADHPGQILLRDSIDLGDDGVPGGTDDDADTISSDPAFLGLTLNDPDDSDRGIFFGEITASVFQADLQATLLVDLPIIFNGNLLSEDLFALVQINDFTEFSVEIDPPTDLINEIKNAVTDLSLENIIAGFRTFVELLKTGLQSDLMTELPLVGDAFDFTGSKLNDLLDFVDDLETFIGPLGDVAEDVLEDLQEFFFNELGPSPSGINILNLDENFDGMAGLTAADVPITFLGADITDADALSLFDAGFQFDLSIGFDEMLEAPLDFGLAGLGLALRSDASLNLRLGLSLDVRFGVDRPRGFFLDLDNTGGTAALDVYVPQGDSLDLQLFFLNLSATPAPLEDFDHNGVSGETLDEDAAGHDLDRNDTIGGMVTEPGDTNGDGILTGGVGFFGDASLSFGSGVITVTSFDEFAPDFSLDARADLDLTLTASIVDNPNLPSISTQLNVDWEFSLGSSLEGLPPDVAFNDITLDIGDFLAKQFGPVLEFFADFFQPLQPILEIVNTEIPVISDLSQLLGAGPVTFGSLLQLLGDGFQELGIFINVLNQLNDIVMVFEGFAETPTIELGDLNFGTGSDFTNPATRSLFSSLTDDVFDPQDILPQFPNTQKTKINDLGDGATSSQTIGFDAGAFHFPIITDPFGVVTGFLFGQDQDLVVWDIPNFLASFNYSQSFGPLFPPTPLFAKISMGFSIFAEFSLGFNTRGLSTGDFANGLFFGDWAVGPGGELVGSPSDDKLEFGISARASAGAELKLVVASAGVQGGIELKIGANWNDVLDDGHFFIDELGQRLQQGIQCIFDLEGALDAFFEAFLKLGLDTPFGFITLFSETFELVRVTLLEFSLGCPPLPIPQPGLLDGGDIRLNIGPHAGDRQAGAADEDEIVEVFGERDLGNDGPFISFPSGIDDADDDGDIDSEDVAASRRRAAERDRPQQ